VILANKRTGEDCNWHYNEQQYPSILSVCFLFASNGIAMDELNCIRAFIKVIETGSFAEAARQTGLARSVMTKRVNQLEEHLQLELMQRTTRSLSLTDTGVVFYERCLPVMAELEEAKASVSAMEWGLTGTFRVSCISSFIASYLADDLCEFQSQHPNLEVDLREYDRFLDPIHEGFDVSLQPTTTVGSSLGEKDLFPMRRLIVATSSYIEKYGNPQSPSELINHRFVHNSHVRPENSIPFVDGNSTAPAVIKPVMVTNTISFLQAAVLSGECMALMPVFFIEKQLISGKLIPILPTIEIQHTVLSAYYRKSPFIPMKIKIFLNFLLDKYGVFPPWEKRLVKARPELSLVLGSGVTKSE